MQLDNQTIFLNRVINKSELKSLMAWIFSNFGATRAAFIADKLKALGFNFATKAGISLSVEDLRVPPDKSRLLSMTKTEIAQTEIKYIRGEITAVERFQKVIDTWNNFSEALKDEVVKYFKQTDPLNPVYMMAFSGARGNISQVRQLVGMRGLMADPQGQIIDLPIISNFREGLTVTEYLISSYGARKGLVDTSLRTADSGYLTRRLVDVAQDIIVRETDCGAQASVLLEDIQDNNKVIVALKDRLLGRTLAQDLYGGKSHLLGARNDIIDSNLAEIIIQANLKQIKVRSPLTCESNRSVCQNCYGSSLAHGKRIDLGEAIGIIAAQSIGEPGTQLTMRTFHTGGVFTGKFAESIRAPFDGTIHYSNSIAQARSIRTRHGEEAFIIEKPTKLIIHSYSNYYEAIILNIGMVAFCKEGDTVKKNEIIAETNPTSRLITEKATKNLILDLSGQVYFANVVVEEKIDKRGNITRINQQEGLIWILSGELYNLPLLANISVNQNNYIKENEILASTTIINENSGIVRLKSKNKEKNNQEIEIITDSVTVEDAFVYANTLGNDYTLSTKENKQFILKVTPEEKLSNFDIIAELIDDTYKTTTGGIIKYSNLLLEKTSQGYQVEGEGTILWIPEETHEVNKDVSLLLVEDGDYVEAGTEIIKDIFANNSGFIEIVQNNDILREVIIKPGYIYKLENSYNFSEFAKHLYYPGEHIVDNLFAEQILYIEYVENFPNNYLLLRPVEEYSVPKNSHFITSFPLRHQKNLIDLIAIKKAEFKDGEIVKSAKGVNLLSTQIILKINTEASQITANIELVPKGDLENFFKLQLVVLETLILRNNLSTYKSINKILVKDKEVVKPKTPIAEMQILSNHSGKVILNQKENLQSFNKLLIVTEANIKTFHIEFEKHSLKEGDLVRVGDEISPNLTLPDSGEIIEINNEEIKLRVARPYLVSSGALLYVNHGDFVEKGENLASLVYERVKTGDIVQGLPRIEEILEARKPKEPCKIAQCPGGIAISYEENYGSTIKIITEDKEEVEYFVGSNQKFLVNHGDYVNIGEPLTDGAINPHEMLNTFFHYYKSIFSLSKAAKTSLQKVQLELLKEIQQVYQSQGVEISDKHIEVIIRQMTSKVIIEDGGDTTLLPGELIEINQIERINETMRLTKGKLASYQPVLLGITKASLNTESFISAASFQETTRVLAEAAIEGKADWLKGLKENVIIGRLIPAGTGFNTYNEMDEKQINLTKNEGRPQRYSNSNVNLPNLDQIIENTDLDDVIFDDHILQEYDTED